MEFTLAKGNWDLSAKSFRAEMLEILESEVSGDAAIPRSDCGDTDGNSVGAFFE